MKTERTYRWRVVDRGRARVTSTHFTEAQVRRDYPECEPEPVLETLRVVDVPETADELLDQFNRTPSGASTAPTSSPDAV